MRGNETAHSNIGTCSLQHGFCRLFFRALTYFFCKEKTSGVTQKTFIRKKWGLEKILGLVPIRER
jgi:hypothetical protein